MPPILFRLGYEWCALTIFGILEQILDTHSDEICIAQSFEPVGRGLYKAVGPEKATDPRRRAALDLIIRLEAFYQARMQGMFFALPRRRSTYTEADDAVLSRVRGDLG